MKNLVFIKQRNAVVSQALSRGIRLHKYVNDLFVLSEKYAMGSCSRKEYTNSVFNTLGSMNLDYAYIRDLTELLYNYAHLCKISLN